MACDDIQVQIHLTTSLANPVFIVPGNYFVLRRSTIISVSLFVSGIQLMPKVDNYTLELLYRFMPSWLHMCS